VNKIRLAKYLCSFFEPLEIVRRYNPTAIVDITKKDFFAESLASLVELFYPALT
jgi:hypothetical protein